MSSFDKKVQTHKHLGPGGMKCVCCGPPPKFKREWLRTGKRRLRRFWKQEVASQLAQ